jgi:opacity protein-like surface antigen
MKTVKISALVLAMAGVFATSANAQSTKTNAWEGAYGQIGVGYGMFTPKIGSGTGVTPNTAIAPAAFGPYAGQPLTALGYPANISNAASASNVNNVNTGIANLALGYNFGIDQTWILGLAATYYPGASSSATGQLSLAPTTISSSNGSFPTIPVPGGSSTATYNVKNLYSIVLTPGYAIDKERLAYLKLGYSGSTIGLSGPTLAYQTTNLSGYTVGLGYKQMFTESLYAFGEVNYASYGTKTISATLTNGTQLQGMTISGNGTDILVGVGYRF